MPIPIILGVGAAILGLGGHLSAKETNEKAQKLAEEAQEIYNAEKEVLEAAKQQTEKDLLDLGYRKKEVVEGSVRRFLAVYEKIKDIQLKESSGLLEISKFVIDSQDALQMQKMSDIYKDTFATGATAAATGAVIALAVNGTLPYVTGILSMAGSVAAMGNIGAAAGMAGSALSLGAAMTPLAAVAAPVVLFTGISSSIKADENLEKAKTMYAKAEAAVEEMKVSEVMCTAISDRSKMFNDLLKELNGMFLECTILLTSVVWKKTGFLKGKTVQADKLTQEELELIAVTRALAGAVKAVIDTPILTAEGELAEDAQVVYENTQESLPKFTETVEKVKSVDYHTKTIKVLLCLYMRFREYVHSFLHFAG